MTLGLIFISFCMHVQTYSDKYNEYVNDINWDSK